MGSLLWLEALLMCICLAIAGYYHEDDLLPFAITIAVTTVGGVACHFVGRKASNNLGRRDAYLLVTVTWIIFSIFGMLPFLLGGYITSVTDAFFETMSGFTTTGASIISDVEQLPHGLLFWRTMTQWIGGLGIVFFTIALLPSLVGNGNIKVFSAETTGPLRTKMHPRLSTSSHAIWMIYIIITVACAVSYFLAGMDVFDCINYAMTTTATGGFSTHNSNTQFFDSPAIEYTGALFMFLSGINFTLLYLTIVKLRIRDFFRNAELRVYIGTILLAIVIMMVCLMQEQHYNMLTSLRYAVFQSVSFITSTGLLSDDAGQWPPVTWIIMALLMVIGGCAGSTAGGIKSMRVAILIKVIRNEFRQVLHPNAVLPVRVNNIIVPQQTRNRLFAFLLLYLILFFVAAIYFAATGIETIDAIVLSLSCLSNVGPTLDINIGTPMTWADLSVMSKWVCTALMLIGRLEIFSVLVLFMPEFWRNR